MATPGQLMEALRIATGIPLPTIVDIDRRLTKAGLRTKTGRGLSAARMTPLDAARLLTALLASAQSNLAVEAVERYALTACDQAQSSKERYKSARAESLTSLPPDHSFVDALAALLSALSLGSLGKGSSPRIEVSALTQATRGRIRIAGLPNGLTASMEYIARPMSAKAGATGKARPSVADAGGQAVGDLEQSRRVTEHTIFSVARILA